MGRPFPAFFFVIILILLVLMCALWLKGAHGGALLLLVR